MTLKNPGHLTPWGGPMFLKSEWPREAERTANAGPLILETGTLDVARAGSGVQERRHCGFRFETEKDLGRYSQDEVRKRWVHLKDRSVGSALLIKGVAL